MQENKRLFWKEIPRVLNIGNEKKLSQNFFKIFFWKKLFLLFFLILKKKEYKTKLEKGDTLNTLF